MGPERLSSAPFRLPCRPYRELAKVLHSLSKLYVDVLPGNTPCRTATYHHQTEIDFWLPRQGLLEGSMIPSANEP
jgi:hypothetical protein